MSESVVLETRDLTVRFGGVTAVNGVQFQLRRTELRCLIGPNGAGKSTFFKCLTGVEKPVRGEVWWNNELISDKKPHEIARLGVGVKTQVPSVMNALSVREHVWLSAYQAHGRHLCRQVVPEMLDCFGLRELAAKQVGNLAHGQRQKVELAMVMAANPSLILLDEPAAGMAEDEVQELAELVRVMRNKASVIIVDHDMNFIRNIADYVTVFHQGEILLEGTADAVLNDKTVRDVYLGKKA